jgi:hypothetical protein
MGYIFSPLFSMKMESFRGHLGGSVMSGKLRKSIAWIATLMCLLGISKISAAQEASGGPLADELKKEYKLTKLGVDTSGITVTQPGAVFVLQKSGVLGVPPANLAIGQATYRDGELHGPSAGQIMFLGQATKLFPIGEKVYVVKIDVNPKKDKVALTIMECDSCNGAQQASSYKALINFQFPKDYLGGADAGQIKDIISQVLTPDSGSNDQQGQNQNQPQAAPQQQAPPPQAAPSAPQTIQLGQTPEQVEAALGPPEKKVNLGAKQIYVYKDLKITFVNGKVSDVQ